MKPHPLWKHPTSYSYQLYSCFLLWQTLKSQWNIPMHIFLPRDLDLWPWPTNLTYISFHLTSMPKVKSIHLSVRLGQWDGQTHTLCQNYYPSHVKDVGCNNLLRTYFHRRDCPRWTNIIWVCRTRRSTNYCVTLCRNYWPGKGKLYLKKLIFFCKQLIKLQSLLKFATTLNPSELFLLLLTFWWSIDRFLNLKAGCQKWNKILQNKAQFPTTTWYIDLAFG